METTTQTPILFTMAGREEMRKRLKPTNPESLFLAERGFLDNDDGSAYTDTQALDLLTDKLKSELARVQSLNDETEVFLDQLIGTHTGNIQNGRAGIIPDPYLSPSVRLWSRLHQARIEAGRKLPGEK